MNDMAITDFSNTPLSEIVSLKGRRAVVTGGARGIGAGIVKRFAEAGASVVIGDIDHAGAAKTAEDVQTPPGVSVEALPLDLESEASILAFADAATEKLGGLDIWVNNAGYYPTAPILEMDISAWDKVQNINLRGAFFSGREAAKRMVACASKHAVIVNIASMAGIRARTNMAHYISAKHGVVGFTKAMALEFGPLNIRILGIAPAHVMVRGQDAEEMKKIGKLYPLGRPGLPDDIARVVLFCASNLSAFMTGSTLMVEGGHWAGVYP
jgi:NAD(P)-dependent dehydrogenase (short-subunit alcohol dehydrogenase family)